VSKKEIRRAARDAFPKAKSASRARSGRGGAYGKRTYQAKPRAAASSGRNVPKPPSVGRSLIMGAVAAVFYFVLIQWVIHLGNSTFLSNLLVAALGLVLFAGVNYLTESIRYRRYVRKRKDSDK
jgi:uncharacterized protein (DUF2062 family)